VRLPASLPTIALDHHRAHAATAFLTSPFDRAAIIVCDSHSERELSVWTGDGNRLDERNWPWQGGAFATLYSECAKLFDDRAASDAHALEVLAHRGRGDRVDELDEIFRYIDGSLHVAPGWRTQLHEMIRSERQQHGHARESASTIQAKIGELLL